MHPSDKWQITWLMRGPSGSSIGSTVIMKGYSLGDGKQIISKYQDKLSKEAGVSLPIKPYFKWFLEYALDRFYEEFRDQGTLRYELHGIEIKEIRPEVKNGTILP